MAVSGSNGPDPPIIERTEMIAESHADQLASTNEVELVQLAVGVVMNHLIDVQQIAQQGPGSDIIGWQESCDQMSAMFAAALEDMYEDLVIRLHEAGMCAAAERLATLVEDARHLPEERLMDLIAGLRRPTVSRAAVHAASTRVQTAQP